MSFFDQVQESIKDQGLDGPKGRQDTLAIADIVIADGRREIREEAVTALMVSIQEIGLLTPAVVTPEKRLVAGAHRIEACRRLGWEQMPVIVIAFDALRGEMAQIDENLARNDLSALERSEAVSRRKVIYEMVHPQAKQGGAPGMKGGGKAPVTKEATVASFADDTAAKTGMSRRTIASDAQIVKGICKEVRDRIRRSKLATERSELLKLARIRSQEEQREIAVMVIDGKAKNVDDAMRRRRLRLRHEEIGAKNAEAAKLEKGEGMAIYGIILADVPWVYQRSISKSRDISNQYEQMSTEEISDIPVIEIAAHDAVLYFWCPAAKVAEAVDIVRRWGFDVRSSMVWDKISQGPGVWSMVEHELVLIATRGNPPPPREGAKPRSIIHAPRRDHSEKPQELYLAIERAYPTMTKVELFARERREGWKSIGLDIDGTDISQAIIDIKARAGMSMEPRIPRADDLSSAETPGPDSATGPTVPPAVSQEN